MARDNQKLSNEMIERALAAATPLKNLPEVNSFNHQMQLNLGKLVNVLIDELRKDQQLSSVVKHSLLRHFFWQATAYNNAGISKDKKGQPFWSANAIRQYYANGTVKDLRHEHTIPIAELSALVLNSKVDCISLMHKYSKAVVLTKTEDEVIEKAFKSKVPIDFNWDKPDFIARYKTSEISPIYDVREIAEFKELLK